MLLHRYRRRSVVALALMISQAFFYNAIFFTYALVLTRFHNVAEDAGRRSTSSRSRSATCSGRCCSGRCSTASGGAG